VWKRFRYVSGLSILFITLVSRSGTIPILEDRPFARALADFGKPGIDTVIDYLEVGDSDKESRERLALFAYVVKAAFELVPVKRGTAHDYVRRYRGDQPSKALDTLIKYLQMDYAELSKLIK
jgi:hypothetical protein